MKGEAWAKPERRSAGALFGVFPRAQRRADEGVRAPIPGFRLRFAIKRLPRLNMADRLISLFPCVEPLGNGPCFRHLHPGQNGVNTPYRRPGRGLI